MRNIRNCANIRFNTGTSACQLDFDKLKGAFIVEHGVKLPSDLTAEKISELCHADAPNRIYPVKTFVEYAKNGGEPQTSSTGYSGNSVSGLNAQTDTLTLDKFYEHLNANLLKVMNQHFDVYFFDAKNTLYGYNDGTDILAGIPMSCIYPTAVPHPTSSNPATMNISFCYEDTEDALKNFDYVVLDFNVKMSAEGLVYVDLVKTADNKYKVIETMGGYDRTAEFGSLIADGAADVVSGITAATYDSATETLTLTSSAGATPKLQSASTLYEAGIVGIEQA